MKTILYIGNKLSQHGVSVTTIETLGPLLQNEGYGVYYSSSKKNIFFRMLDMLWSILRYRSSIDFVLIDTYSTSSFWYALLTSQMARLFDIKYIPILHGGNLPDRLKNNPKLCSFIFSNAYYNVAPSHYLLHHFQLHGFGNTIFIPNSIEIENYPFRNRKITTPHLLWVRAFASNYNPTLAVDVLEKVKEIYPDATLTMIGPDKDGSLERTKKYALSKNLEVVFTGRLSKKKWIAYSEQCSLFINTTNFDNTPVSVMEAMALGLPVVSTNVGGIPYLLEDNVDALLTHSNDREAMALAVLRLVSNTPLRNTLVANAREKAQNWDWEIVKLLWKEVLQ